MAPTTSLVPPRRLGALLRNARQGAGQELRELTVSSGLSVVELDDIEHGRRDLDEATLTALLASYGVDDATLVPARSQLVIDLDEGRIAVNHDGVEVDSSYGPDAILTRYLSLVYRLRELPVGSSLPLRDVDIDVLSTSLSLASLDVEHRLERLIGSTEDVIADQRRIRRQLVLPLVGVVIAATAVGTLLLVAHSDDPAPAPDVDTAIATAAIQERPVPTDLGNGGAVELNTDS
jgi:transcriptional regulator with XRE-family HTH domain